MNKAIAIFLVMMHTYLTAAIQHQTINDAQGKPVNCLTGNKVPQLNFSGTIKGSKNSMIDLRGCLFSRSTFKPGTTFSYVDFKGATFPPLKTLSNIIFDHCSLQGASFVASKLDHTTVQFSNFQDAIFNFASIANSSFDASILKNVHASPIKLSNTTFSLVNAENANFERSLFNNVIFTKLSLLSGASFQNLKAGSSDVTFGGGDLGNLDLSYAKFGGANIKNLTISGMGDEFGVDVSDLFMDANTRFDNPTFTNICITKDGKQICADDLTLEELKEDLY